MEDFSHGQTERGLIEINPPHNLGNGNARLGRKSSRAQNLVVHPVWLFVDFRGMRELTGVQAPGGWKVRRPKRLGVPGGATLPVSTLKDCLFPVLSVAVAFGNASTIAGGAGADAPARFLDTSHGF